MTRFTLTYALFILFMLFPCFSTAGLCAENRDIIEENESHPEYRIYPENDILFCTGDDIAGRENNRGAEMMLAGRWSEAAEVFENGLLHAPLFYPYRYNLGICYLYLNRLDIAHMHFTKGVHLVPEYYRTYLQLGYIYGRWNKDSEALDYYRKALKLHPGELNTYILMGDINFNRHQLSTARKYYEEALAINHLYPNGLLGLAKIHFANEEYVKTIVLLKSVDISGDYDKSLHYYYAESAFRIGDYRTAAREYENLLKFRHDRFFLVNSGLLIKHKLELSRRFTER